MLHSLTFYLFDPVVLIFLLLAAALVAGRFGRVWQQRLLAAAVALLFCLAFLPVDRWLARPLENQYPRPPLPARVDGILVLDGGSEWRVFASRGVQGHNASVFRILAGAELAKRFPAATLVYTGASSDNPRIEAAERATVGDVAATAGVAPGRLRFEQASRDTGQNVVDSMKLVHPRPGETWMLVTSAIHMPRAMAIAKRLGWKMVPWPSDYISGDNAGLRFRLPSREMVNIGTALHEWIGLAVYGLTGRA
ncbi:MAG: YdcF family protein [Rhizomicrobium sp.]